MAYVWDLTRLYSKHAEFYFDMTLVRDKIKKISEYREFKVDGNSLFNLMNECFNIREINSKTLLYASLNYYKDINNDKCINMKMQAEELDIFVNNETNFIDELISIIDNDKLEEFYKECSDLLKYKYYIDNIRRLSNHIINDKYNDLNKCIMKKNNLLSQYNTLIMSMDFGCVNKINLNNTNISNYLVDNKRVIRKKAFTNLNTSYLEKGKDYFDIFNKLVDIKKEISICNNYNSVLESELFKEELDDKIINNLIVSVNDNIPLMNKYLSFKMHYLNVKNPRLYDINIPICKINDKFDKSRAWDIIFDSLSVLGKDYVNVVKKLLEEGSFDLELDEKKHPRITFSWNTFTFINYRDSYLDLKNLIHEIGHIVNSYYSQKKQLFIYSDSSSFTSEVMSLVNEILLNDYLYNQSSNKDEKIFYLTKNIENFIGQVFRQTLYTEFENIVYNNKMSTLDEVNDYYLDLINKYYGNVTTIDEDIKCEWMRVGHLFRWNYYVYKYAIGYILAFNIVKKIKKDNSKYIDFISSGSSCSNVDMLKKLNIDLNDEKLFKNSFDVLEEYISLLIKLCEEK